LLADLGVAKTHSRPHVSNDNPFSEAQFKTLKYRPSYPDRFGSLADARQWMRHMQRIPSALPDPTGVASGSLDQPASHGLGSRTDICTFLFVGSPAGLIGRRYTIECSRNYPGICLIDT
jgi:hypothetical protein